MKIILNTFARDIFRTQADCDCISARMNYRLHLRQQFLWSGQQAIEKYLKAILLFNGKSARYYESVNGNNKKTEFFHDLVALDKEVRKLDLLCYSPDHEDTCFLSFLSRLERVLKRGPEDLTRQALVWANLYFGQRQRSAVSYSGFSSSEVPPHERSWENVDWSKIEEYVKPPRHGP